MWYLFDRIIFSVKFIPLQRWIVDSNIGKLHGFGTVNSRKPLGEKSLALKMKFRLPVLRQMSGKSWWEVRLVNWNAGLEIILRVFFLCFSGGERKEETVFPKEKRKILLLSPISILLGGFCFMLILKTSESDWKDIFPHQSWFSSFVIY